MKFTYSIITMMILAMSTGAMAQEGTIETVVPAVANAANNAQPNFVRYLVRDNNSGLVHKSTPMNNEFLINDEVTYELLPTDGRGSTTPTKVVRIKGK